MQLRAIISARNVIDRFKDDRRISAKLSYQMTKFMARTQTEYDFYKSKLALILSSHAEMTEDGGITIPSKEIANINYEIEEMLQTEVEDPGVRFSLSQIDVGLKLSMKEIYPLLDFIDENR